MMTSVAGQIKNPEWRRIVNKLEERPEIHNKLNYYKQVLLATEENEKALAAKIWEIEQKLPENTNPMDENYYEVVSKTLTTDERLELSKLKLSLLDIQASKDAKLKWHKEWMRRSEDWEMWMEDVTAKRVKYMEIVIADIKKILPHHKNRNNIQQLLDMYSPEEKDTRIQNEVYLCLVHELEKFRSKDAKRLEYAV